MNIVHLLSQNHLTGAEVYAVALAAHQTNSGHQVYQISNGFFSESTALQIPIEVETRSRWQRLQNILWLRRFIKENNIHVIHTHSRAAVKLAYWSTLFTKTAVVSTVHGIQHPSFSKKIHNQYGQFIIAVCENIKRQLIRDFKYSDKMIKVLPNGISSDLYKFERKAASLPLRRIAIIGRTTGPKGERTAQVLQAFQSDELKHLDLEISLVGGKIADLHLPESTTQKVQEIQNATLNSQFYAQYDLVIGSGRVCMESLITGCRTLAFGEACYVGTVTDETYTLAKTSNFGDVHPDSKKPQINTNQFVQEILNPPEVNTEELSAKASEDFSVQNVAQSVERLYESAYFLKHYPHWIPTLMYHKIPNHEIQSQHKIYVTKANFEKHLKFFKRRGFETLTFSELEAFRKGTRDFSQFPPKPLMLTFDDGYRDNLENASPLLTQYGFKAQLFLLANPEINSNNWDTSSTDEPSHEIIAGAERQKWKYSAFEIGSHGFSHRKITDLTKEEALEELRLSKASLEKELSVPINVFAFTYGIISSDSAELAQKAGYSYAVNTDTGGLLQEQDPFAIFRVNIFPDESLWSLFKKTSRWYRNYYFKKRGK
ncbi:polysaccharide deacetylase family protein [Pseudobdellovibrio exovorus]|uniref:NodB homology domain-containing protein n=1 Tax=Pseudobdellovibrio exovorus JSS TaxID=1184267 RepID=M4VBC3_9BACT|nr:polysaccharide deacetylase family protein [Pseudobdellovibrio exovorus]AGH95326.1 hypothetical protein A11Q_1110 [Pseudobdellovibrio exovorus JSS]